MVLISQRFATRSKSNGRVFLSFFCKNSWTYNLQNAELPPYSPSLSCGMWFTDVPAALWHQHHHVRILVGFLLKSLWREYFTGKAGESSWWFVTIKCREVSSGYDLWLLKPTTWNLEVVLCLVYYCNYMFHINCNYTTDTFD